MTYRAKCERRRQLHALVFDAPFWTARIADFLPNAQVARRAKVRRSHAAFENPFVCPGCHAFEEEPCKPGCIDDEMRREREEAMLYGEYDYLNDGCDDEEGAA